MHDSDRLGGNWWLMPVEGVADDIPVLDLGCERRDRLTIDLDFARLYGVFLGLSVRFLLCPAVLLDIRSILPAYPETHRGRYPRCLVLAIVL